jgi:hypothetical protein
LPIFQLRVILDAVARFSPKRQLEKLLEREQAELERIIGIMCVVGYAVGGINCLDFE